MTHDAPRRRLGSKGTMALVVLLSMAPPLCTDLYMSSLPTIAADLGTTDALASLTMTVFFLFMAAGMLVSGPLSDKHGRRPVLLSSVASALAFSIACIFSPNIWFMLLCRVFQGVGAGGMVSLAVAIVRDRYEGTNLNRALSLTQAIAMFAPMIAPLLGVLVLQFGSWRMEFVVLSALMGIGFIGTLLLEETLEPDKRITGSMVEGFVGFAQYLRSGAFVRMMGIGAVTNIPYMAYLAVASFIYIQFFQVSTVEFGVFFAVASIAAILGPWTSMKLAGCGIRTSMGVVLGASVLSAVALFTVGRLAPVAFLLSFVPFMFASTLARPTVMSWLLERAQANVGAASSLSNFAFTALGCLGMVLVTADWPDQIFGLACITGASVAIACVLWGVSVARMKGER